MNRFEKGLYIAKANTTGGRAGMSRSSDGRLEVRLSRPSSLGTGINPVQLFAAPVLPANAGRWEGERSDPGDRPSSCNPKLGRGAFGGHRCASFFLSAFCF